MNVSEFKRALETWEKCDPKAMSTMSPTAIYYGFSDAQADIVKLHRQLAALREELATQRNHFREQLRGAKNADELQQRLTAAEQRNAVMTKALERITRPHDCGCVPCTGSCTSKYALEITLEEIREIADAALKPTESGASE